MIRIRKASVIAVIVGAALSWLLTLVSEEITLIVCDLLIPGWDISAPTSPDGLVYYPDEVLLALMPMSILMIGIPAYITATIAGTAEIVHAVCFGIIDLTSSLVLMPIDMDGPVWYTVTVYVLIIPWAALGGYVRQRVRLSHQRDVLEESDTDLDTLEP